MLVRLDGRRRLLLQGPPIATANDLAPAPRLGLFAFARHGGKTYSKPEADRALALTLAFFRRHLQAAALADA